MMEASILPGTLWRESEFVGGLTGACGPNALAMAESWALQRSVGTLAVYQRMRAAGRCDPNGPATIGGLREQAAADGFAVELLAFREPMPAGDWRGFFGRYVGQRAVVMETAHGQALVDSLSGKGENARNLKYHFLLVAGWHPGGHAARVGRDLPAGWWCADGDNFAVGDVLQFYPDTVLAAAQPSAALAIEGKASVSAGGGAASASATPFVRLADGRGKDTRTGEVLGGGFMDYCLSHNVRQKCIKGETAIEPGAVAAFFDGGLILYYTQGGAVTDQLGGYVALGLLKEREADRGQLVTARADLAAAAKARDAAESEMAALNAQVTDLKAQVASAQQQLAAQPVAQAPQGAQTALALVGALKAALG